jgi:hypothetical protein
MRTRLRLLLLAIACCGCSDSPSTGIIPFDTQNYAFDFPVGGTRLMLRTFMSESGQGVRYNHSLGWFRIEKDTSFEGYPAQVVEGSIWEPYDDTILRYGFRELYVREDSQVSVYLFRSEQSGSFLIDLLKPAAADTGLFSDRMIPIRFPLVAARPWPIRPAGDPFHSLPLDKEMEGADTLEFKGARYACAVLVLHTVPGVPLRSWVSRIGVLKAEVDFGKWPNTDSAGLVDTIHSVESYALLDRDVDSATVAGYFGRYGNGPFPGPPAGDELAFPAGR